MPNLKVKIFTTSLVKSLSYQLLSLIDFVGIKKCYYCIRKKNFDLEGQEGWKSAANTVNGLDCIYFFKIKHSLLGMVRCRRVFWLVVRLRLVGLGYTFVLDVGNEAILMVSMVGHDLGASVRQFNSVFACKMDE